MVHDSLAAFSGRRQGRGDLRTLRGRQRVLAEIEERQREGEDATKDIPLIREYRIGEFLDVQISVEDIMEPLLRAAVEDLPLSEELVLAIWSGVAASLGTSSSSRGEVTLASLVVATATLGPSTSITAPSEVDVVCQDGSH